MSPYYYHGTIKAEHMTREQAIDAYIWMCRRSDQLGSNVIRVWDRLPRFLRWVPSVKALYRAALELETEADHHG